MEKFCLRKLIPSFNVPKYRNFNYFIWFVVIFINRINTENNFKIKPRT